MNGVSYLFHGIGYSFSHIMMYWHTMVFDTKIRKQFSEKILFSLPLFTAMTSKPGYLILFCLWLSSSCLLMGQSNIDSLLQVRSNTGHDTIRVSIDVQIANSLTGSDFSSSQFYFNRALDLAEALNDKFPGLEPEVLHQAGLALIQIRKKDTAITVLNRAMGIQKARGLKEQLAMTQFDLGYTYQGMTQFETAILHYDSVIFRNLEEGTNYRLARSYNYSGLCNYYLRRLDRSSERILEAIRYRKETGDTARIHYPYMVYGLIHRAQEQYEGAKVYIKKSLEIARLAGAKSRVRLAYTNLSFVLLDQDSTDAAIENMTAAWEISKEMGYAWGSVRYFNLLGDIEVGRGNFQKAHGHYENAIEYLLPSTAPQSKADVYSDLARAKVYLADSVWSTDRVKRNGLLNDALPIAINSLKLASKANSGNVKLKTSEILAEIYAKINRHKEAYELIRTAKTISEEINDKARTDAIAKMTTEFETERIEAQNDLLRETQKAQTAQLRQKNFVIYGAIVVLVLILIIGAVIYRSRLNLKKANKTIEKSLSEKELLLKEIHHRVKNNLQVVSSLLDLQSRGIEDEEALATFMEGQNRVKAMALIHQKLYQNENLATINFKEYSKLLSTELAAVYQSNKKVRTEIIASGQLDFDIDVAVPLGLILNELISNAYKYAFDDQDGSLAVSLESLGEGKHQMTVADNGRGLPSDFDIRKAKSLGLRLVRRLAKQLYGTVTYSGDKGAKFVVIFTDTIERKAV